MSTSPPNGPTGSSADHRGQTSPGNATNAGNAAGTERTASPPPHAPTKRRGHLPSVGPKLRIVLVLLLILVAIMGANSAYLGSITFLSWMKGQSYENYFYLQMFLLHLILGFILIVPFIAFVVPHIWVTRTRRNYRAIRIGYAMTFVSIAILVTGILLMRLEGFFQLKQPAARSVVYWLHVATPFVAAWLYWLHRLVGPKIRWRVGLTYAAALASLVVAMMLFHSHDPRTWNVRGPKDGAKYYEPSLARTATGSFIPADTLMMDAYCLKCHQDAYKGWFHSSHHFSSFNNPAYLASVRETRDVLMARDGNVKSSRWCAGCHDPVPFFSGAFDDPKFDDVKHSTAHAGITCTVCHSITHVNTKETTFSSVGNADYTIEEPIHYPFAKSDNAILQWVNNQLVKAKPTFHKNVFLKPIHKSPDFCASCHKVSLPGELNHYKDWLRGQNHFDSYHLSGASGHGARSFYYPAKSFENCNSCHMSVQPSNDFGAQYFGTDKLSIHSHQFATANTGLAQLLGERLQLKNVKTGEVLSKNADKLGDMNEIIKSHQDYLKQGFVRLDLFGIREGWEAAEPVKQPLRPTVPELEPGKQYLLEAVIRTLKIGHHFSQGTVDSNEIWLDVTVSMGDKVIGRNGGIDKDGTVDPWSHFINVYMLDRHGNRIDRRNPQDIFVPLYDKQVPPGAAHVAHYGLQVPNQVSAPIKVDVKLQYRKFDKRYMDFVTSKARPGDLPIHGHTPGKPFGNPLVITTIAQDSITFPVKGVATKVINEPSPIKETWQRWNDYGIALFFEADPTGGLLGSQAGGSSGRGNLRNAELAFTEVEKMKRADGPVNLARIFFVEGRLDEAVAALNRAAKFTDPPAPAWTLAWLSGLINRQEGHLDKAIENFRSVLHDRPAEAIARGFDFSEDYIVNNELGLVLFEQAKRADSNGKNEERDQFLKAAIDVFNRTLKFDSENVVAHANLGQLYDALGQADKSAEHAKLHLKYKPDDNARDAAVVSARKKSPAANRAAERFVIYPLHDAQRTNNVAGQINPTQGSRDMADQVKPTQELREVAVPVNAPKQPGGG